MRTSGAPPIGAALAPHSVERVSDKMFRGRFSVAKERAHAPPSRGNRVPDPVVCATTFTTAPNAFRKPPRRAAPPDLVVVIRNSSVGNLLHGGTWKSICSFWIVSHHPAVLGPLIE